MDNDLLKTYTHLLTGYVGNDKFLLALSDVVKALRASNPDIIYSRSRETLVVRPLRSINANHSI